MDHGTKLNHFIETIFFNGWFLKTAWQSDIAIFLPIHISLSNSMKKVWHGWCKIKRTQFNLHINSTQTNIYGVIHNIINHLRSRVPRSPHDTKAGGQKQENSCNIGSSGRKIDPRGYH